MKKMKMKMKMKNNTTIRDFGFTRIRNSARREDITEWFSDYDINLSEIINDYNKNAE